MGSLKLTTASSGSVILSPANTASDVTITVPAQTATMATLTTPSFASTIGVGGATPASSGAGITFPATQSASSDANTLDDYEEGTWTPTSAGGMSGFSAINGTYVKIGRLVNIRCAFSITGVITNMTLSGLPFAAATTYYSVVYSGINVSIAFSFVRTDSSIEWNVNTTGGGNQTINMTAWYQV